MFITHLFLKLEPSEFEYRTL